jgi:hypothetical protein
MNRERARELLPIIQQYADGKDVQFKDMDGNWVNIGRPTWTNGVDYRIKPEPLHLFGLVREGTLINGFPAIFFNKNRSGELLQYLQLSKRQSCRKIRGERIMTLSYHNDPKVKEFHVRLAKHHYDADMLRAGTYGEDDNGFKACSVGCMDHDINPEDLDYHAAVADSAGWPEWLVKLSDFMFEGLPEGTRNRFHVDLREAIPVGVDLEPVRHRLAICRIDRLIALQSKNKGHGIDNIIDQVIAAMMQVRRFHEAEIGGQVCDVSFEKAAEAARSAALSAAEEAAAWIAERDDLLRLLREAV